MGCDIHARLEIKKYGNGWESASVNVNDHLPRNYAIFGKLAGVRSDEYDVMPKGFPIDANWQTKEAYYTEVMLADDDPRLSIQQSGLYFISEKKAKRCLESGAEMIKLDGEFRLVDSEWHSPSWSTTQEVKQALTKLEDEGQYVDADWKILLSVMEQYEDIGYPCRLVYWFDN